jgi:lysophospholipase L1-like esterase
MIAGGCALVLAGAIAGWARRPIRRTLALLAVCLAVTEAVNLGAIMVTAYTAPARLRAVSSLTALVGQSPLPAVHAAAGPPEAGVRAVVIGDSTAAGLGLPGLAHTGKLDRACHRSKDAYPARLAAVNHWRVLNLACSGATIPAGLLGPQKLSKKVTAPAQLSKAMKATRASVVIVGIGANDVGWSGLVRLCAVAMKCNNSASRAYFQQQLATFSEHYYQLLGQLAGLPSHPRILVNLYYDPFDPARSCLKAKELTPAKEQSLLGLLHALNKILAQGAQAAAQVSVQPYFTGHALCDPGPYVQGAKDPAPFHPTAAGQLAIALADEQALQRAGQRVSASPSASAG